MMDRRWLNAALSVLAVERESADSLSSAALARLHSPARLSIISALTNF
jgi:hypothetical protein